MTLKEQLFNRVTITDLALLIESQYVEFDTEGFIEHALMQITDKELKERITVLRYLLEKHLPKDYKEATSIILNTIKVAPPNKFTYGSFLEFIEFNGCNDTYINYTIELMKEYTKGFSAEFVIRRFINEYEDKMYSALVAWSLDENVDVRRLVSEGLRPKLPWAVKINIDYKKAANPLDNLFYDSERYVTRSVANHLNDISKIDPTFVISTLRRWKKTKKQNRKEMEYIINHSLRTLVKKGHEETLSFLGYKNNVDITCKNLTFEKDSISIGDTLKFKFELHSKDSVKLIIDYIVTYPSLTKKPSKKVYKLKEIKMVSNQTVELSGTRSFKLISTRTMRPGIHKLIIQVNGKQYIEQTFKLKK